MTGGSGSIELDMVGALDDHRIDTDVAIPM
jgi:hypothetical protein